MMDAIFSSSNMFSGRTKDPVLDPMWGHGMFVIPYMTRLGITNSWGSWSIMGEGSGWGTITNPGIWCYKCVAGAYIVFFGLCFLASIWHFVYWDLEKLVMNVHENPFWICARSLEYIYFLQVWLALVEFHDISRGHYRNRK
ncbi:hypothetical protein R6Q59_028647 [Mikania micrantha]